MNTKSNANFKGYPLKDFLGSDALNIKNIFKNSFLKNAIQNHIVRYDRKINTKDLTLGRYNIAAPDNNRNIYEADLNSDFEYANPGKDQPSFEERFWDFFDGLYLGNFTTSAILPGKRRISIHNPKKLYMYDIGFNTDKVTGFIVGNPMDTLITFEPRDPRHSYGLSDQSAARIPKAPKMKAVRRTTPRCTGDQLRLANEYVVTTFKGPDKASIVCDLNFRIIVDEKNRLQSFGLYGDTIKIHLSKGLVQPVQQMSSGKWVTTGKRFGFDLGERIITFRKNRLPSWGGVIDLGESTVLITSSNLVGKLRKVNLGGTPDQPLIVFDDVEILK